MAYRPPAFRKPEEIELTTSHFPSLGSTTSSKPTLSYAAKAQEWKERKEEIEMNERIEAELKIQREERARQKKEEEDYLRSTFAVRRQAAEPVKQTIVKETPVESEWTTVRRKPRKEKKTVFEYEDIPPPEIDAEDPEYNDRESIW